MGEVGIRQLSPGIELGTADLRVAFRQIEAAIRGQAAEKDVAESLGRGVTAGRDIAHGEALKSEKVNFTASSASEGNGAVGSSLFSRRHTHGLQQAGDKKQQGASHQEAGRWHEAAEQRQCRCEKQ